MRVLHVLHHSVPNLTGYSIRSKYIIECQDALGHEAAIATSAQHGSGDVRRERIDGRQFFRTEPQPERKIGLREAGLMNALRKTVEIAVREFQPQVIHAASPVLVGLPALHVARRHKIPFVYEVRDLWENASVDRGKWEYDSLPYRGARALESIVYRRADAVVTICEALREELQDRVTSASLHVVPNGVESEKFQVQAPSQRVIDKYGFAGKEIIGYIGAFQPYEGLETLIDAMPAVHDKNPKAHLMITGGGNEMEPVLRERAKSADLDELITFTGRVPHSEVQEMYSVIDIMAYPRIRTRTTELTTPLKPLEAMALKIPVLLSNTRAMLELVSEETGWTFEAGDTNSLAESLVAALADAGERARRAENARRYVENERHWPSIIESYREVYRQAQAHCRAR